MNITEVQSILEKRLGCKITQSSIAHALGKEPSNINRKARRGTELKLSEVQAIEKHFNVSILDKSNTPLIIKDSKFNTDSLRDIIEIIEDFLVEENLSLTPSKKAELIATIYELYVNGCLTDVRKDNIIQLCRLAS